MLAKIVSVALLASAGLVAAAPAPVYNGGQGTETWGANVPTGTINPNVPTHSVTVGATGDNPNSLNYEPNNLFVNPGEIVEFIFMAKNHSVAQSSFGNPCMPLTDSYGNQDGIFAGFNFATAPGSQNPDVFQIVIEDTQPVWIYCPQTDGNHCQAGMVLSINQNPDSPNNLTAYTAASKATSHSVVPNVVQGGVIETNPNPGSGFN